MHMDRQKILIIVIQVVVVLSFLIVSAGGIQFSGVKNGDVYVWGREIQQGPPQNGKLTVLTWNISYAYGIGSSGRGYIPHSPKEFQERLARIGRVIRDSNADIVFLQEVDFNSHRSHHVNQLKELSQMTGLNFVAPAVSWQANYIPYPLWPIPHHFGKVYSGGAVLSRYPILNNQVVLHPKPASNSWLRNMFYLFRYSQQVQIQIGSKNVIVLNNHLESYDKKNRIFQGAELARLVELIDSSHYLIIFGGDMNTIPLEASVRRGFADDEKGNFSDDTTMEIICDIHGFKEVVSPQSYLRNEPAYFTYPSDAPNRRLDYIFVPDNMKIVEAGVLKTGITSDHLPIKAVLEWNYN